MNGFLDSELPSEIVAKTPLGRIGQPSDVAPAVVFLASGDAGWITGETIKVSGGQAFRNRVLNVSKVIHGASFPDRLYPRAGNSNAQNAHSSHP
jgi:NAD(P)-dependent dehydrogenase (short-subunit alcohol dehydrogenase family)